MKKVGDAELLRRYREEGCERSLAEVVERYRPMVFRTCKGVLDRHAAAADATQDVFVLLLHKLERLPGLNGLGSWLYWVALNVSRGHRRAMIRRERAEREVPLHWSGGSCSGLPPAEIRLELHSAMESLPERNRAALHMAYYQGMPHKEIAWRLGVPAATLRSRVSAGLRRLRSRLAPPVSTRM